mmetsp:Transcript_20160/g.36221  ORF Transcript_20160/g.36221 Transcript_20160/m.36221 type:complete len:797 (-) Transcript_20160:1681-4071(-)
MMLLNSISSSGLIETSPAKVASYSEHKRARRKATRSIGIYTSTREEFRKSNRKDFKSSDVTAASATSTVITKPLRKKLIAEELNDGEQVFDIVLSSGFLAFAHHSGFLKAIEESGVKIGGVMGTSAGALTGSLFCAGYSADEVAAHLSKERPALMLRPSLSPWKGGILTLSGVVERLRDLLPPTFEELKLEFAVGVVTADGRHFVIDSGPLPEAVAASAAIPFVFEGVDIPGLRPLGPFKDGGVVDRVGLKAWRNRRRAQIARVHGREVTLVGLNSSEKQEADEDVEEGRVLCSSGIAACDSLLRNRRSGDSVVYRGSMTHGHNLHGNAKSSCHNRKEDRQYGISVNSPELLLNIPGEYCGGGMNSNSNSLSSLNGHVFCGGANLYESNSQERRGTGNEIHLPFSSASCSNTSCSEASADTSRGTPPITYDPRSSSAATSSQTEGPHGGVGNDKQNREMDETSTMERSSPRHGTVTFFNDMASSTSPLSTSSLPHAANDDPSSLDDGDASSGAPDTLPPSFSIEDLPDDAISDPSGLPPLPSPPPCLVHVITRSSPFSGSDDVAHMGEKGLIVVHSPKAGANFLTLGDFDSQRLSAVLRTDQALRNTPFFQAAVADKTHHRRTNASGAEEGKGEGTVSEIGRKQRSGNDNNDISDNINNIINNTNSVEKTGHGDSIHVAVSNSAANSHPISTVGDKEDDCLHALSSAPPSPSVSSSDDAHSSKAFHSVSVNKSVTYSLAASSQSSPPSISSSSSSSSSISSAVVASAPSSSQSFMSLLGHDLRLKFNFFNFSKYIL